MAVIKSGATSDQLTIDATSKAARATLYGTDGTPSAVGAAAASGQHVIAKPLAHGSLGHYRIARRFVPAATTLAGNLWCFRNTGANIAVIHRITLQIIQVAAPTAAIEDRFNAKIARSYTASDSTGSAAITPAAAMQKMRTNMGNSTVEVREANIAAGASGGTKTLDTDAFASGSAWVGAALAAGLGPIATVIDYEPAGHLSEHPLVLANNEGFIIANENNFGATSGIVLQIDLAWAEVSAF